MDLTAAKCGIAANLTTNEAKELPIRKTCPKSAKRTLRVHSISISFLCKAFKPFLPPSVILLELRHCIGHPENTLFLVIKRKHTPSKYPKNT